MTAPAEAADEGTTQPTVYLVRHGETEWSRSGRHTGLTDVPLTAAGRAQARAIADRLAGIAFATVLSSPLSRALDTARLAGFADVVEIAPDLHEWDYGAYEGITTAEIRRRVPGWSVWTHPVPEGETAADVTRRTDGLLARVTSGAGPIALFGHGHILRAIGARWLEEPVSFGRRLALATATVSILGWERETAVIEAWNDPCHLP